MLPKAMLVLAVALMGQAGLGRLWPEAYRLVDAMLLPVIWYAIAVSQRAGMLVGCGAGLLQDAWFQVGLFGINGFKKTLLGWLLGGLGSRFDLNGHFARLVSGGLASLADGAMDVGLQRLLDQNVVLPGLGQMLLRALVTGCLVVTVFTVERWFRRRRELR